MSHRTPEVIGYGAKSRARLHLLDRCLSLFWVVTLTLPASFAYGTEPAPLKIDCSAKDAKTVVWRAHIGSQVGMIVAAGGNLLVGADGTLPESAERSENAVLACVDAATGATRWRVGHARLPDRVNDLPGSPIVSRPAIDGAYAYYVSNRGELCCVRLRDGARLWALDMPHQLGVFKRDPSDVAALAPSPLVVGDTVYCVTGNGRDSLNEPMPHPEAPSFIAVDKATGAIKWMNRDPGPAVVYGQWSTPALANAGGRPEILFPGGDGLLYALDPRSGLTLWKLDCDRNKRQEDRSFTVAPPLVDGRTVYLSQNRDCEQGAGVPHDLLAVSLVKKEIAWRFSDPSFDGTFGELVTTKDRLYAACPSGMLVAIDKRSGQLAWRRMLPDVAAGGVCHYEDRLLVATGRSVCCFECATGAPAAEFSFSDSVDGTPVLIGTKMFVGVRGDLVCADISGLGQHPTQP